MGMMRSSLGSPKNFIRLHGQSLKPALSSTTTDFPSASADILGMTNIHFLHFIQRQIGRRHGQHSSPFAILQAILGLYPFAPTNLLLLDPHLPDWLPELFVHNLHVGKASVSITSIESVNARTSRWLKCAAACMFCGSLVPGR